jgi:hypothetical protein
MKQIEIETWALRILERVDAKSPIEDAAIELKAEWIEPIKAARRLAGHANASRGNPLLWLVGVDEKNGVVVGAKDSELSSWFAVVSSQFNESFTPTLINVNVPYKGKTVCALFFETVRAPFLVKNPDQGKVKGDAVTWEVPWREGNATRTATRSDLLLLLSPLRRNPKIEVLHSQIVLTPAPKGMGTLRLQMSLYVTPVDEMRLVFPFHKCSGIIGKAGLTLASNLQISLKPPSTGGLSFGSRLVFYRQMRDGTPPPTKIDVRQDKLVEATDHDIVIRGPSKIDLTANVQIELEKVQNAEGLDYIVTLVEAVTESRITLSGMLSTRQQRQNEQVWLRKDCSQPESDLVPNTDDMGD